MSNSPSSNGDNNTSSDRSTTTSCSEPPKKMQKLEVGKQAEKTRKTTTTSRSLIRDQFQGPYSRSFPGQPPKERYGLAYNQPFSQLSIKQREAAKTLFGIHDGDDHNHWEEIMPRRSYGNNTNFVLFFQTRIWNQLTPQEQEAAKILDMSEQFWNDQLALFHDDLWSIPGVTLTTKEFTCVLKTIRKMSQKKQLTKKQLAQFLLSLERLLLPSQGAAIAATLKASPSWESLLEVPGADDTINTAQYNSRFHVHLVIASFLSQPARFVMFPHEQLNHFWNDDSHGCVWGNAAGRADDDNSATNNNSSNSSTNNNKKKKKPYGVAVTELLARRRVEPILVGGVPQQQQPAKEEKATTGSTPSSPTVGLPPLPKPVVKYMLDEILGIPVGSIDPFQVSWLYGYDVTLTVFF